jgi:hypothetical protein
MGGWISMRAYKKVAKTKLASNKIRVFLVAAKVAAAKGYKKMEE